MKEIDSVSNEIISLVNDWEPVLISLPEDIISQRRNSLNRTIRSSDILLTLLQTILTKLFTSSIKHLH
jgi:hypothetical protein